MRIGIDLDDTVAECAVPYVREFAREFGLDLPVEGVGWHTLSEVETVPQAEKDRFRIALYDGPFFEQLEPYADCPATLERMVRAGHELHFITARAERRRVVTETWLRRKGLMEHARAVHLKPMGDFVPDAPRGRYDANSSARFKVRLARALALDVFCEDDATIARALAGAGTRVWLFDQPWNRDVDGERIERVGGWQDVAVALRLP